MEICQDGLKDVLPPAYSARSSVYTYGGSPYSPVIDGRIIFSNQDNSLNLLDPTSRKVTTLLSSIPTLRYGAFATHPTEPWVLAVEEDHEHNDPADVKNYVVAINIETREIRRVVSGADFYYTPQFGPDGSKMTWLQWNHPDLPFSSASLYWADWISDGLIRNPKVISGTNYGGVAEPRWGPDNTLYFGQEVNGYRQLFRIPSGSETASQIRLDGLENAEIGELTWIQGR
jgi:hypothetical protein